MPEISEKALEAAAEVVMKLDREGIIDVEDGILHEDELIDWIAGIIHKTYAPVEVSPATLVDALMELGEGSDEHLREY